jgi:hypothetical protein
MYALPCMQRHLPYVFMYCPAQTVTITEIKSPPAPPLSALPQDVSALSVNQANETMRGLPALQISFNIVGTARYCDHFESLYAL